jgi:hypothetical protein
VVVVLVLVLVEILFLQGVLSLPLLLLRSPLPSHRRLLFLLPRLSLQPMMYLLSDLLLLLALLLLLVLHVDTQSAAADVPFVALFPAVAAVVGLAAVVGAALSSALRLAGLRNAAVVAVRAVAEPQAALDNSPRQRLLLMSVMVIALYWTMSIHAMCSEQCYCFLTQH